MGYSEVASSDCTHGCLRESGASTLTCSHPLLFPRTDTQPHCESCRTVGDAEAIAELKAQVAELGDMLHAIGLHLEVEGFFAEDA